MKVLGSVPHGDSEIFLCFTLVTRRKTSLSISLSSSKLTIPLISMHVNVLYVKTSILTTDCREGSLSD